MACQKTVVDASIVIKWFVNEQGTNEALKLREDHLTGKVLLIVPELLFIEVLNALRYKNKIKNALIEINKTLWDTQFHIEKISSFILEKASCLAIKHNLSLYDSLYLALSILHGSPLITADQDLSKVLNTILMNETS